MTEIIISIVVSLLTGGGFVALINYGHTRRLTQKQAEQAGAQTENIAVQTLKEAIETINSDVIKPLKEENKVIKSELKRLTNELIRFRKAIESIPTCAYAHQCPATHELQERTGCDAGARASGNPNH